MKLTGNETATREGQLKYDKYAAWIVHHFDFIERKLKKEGIYSPEVLSDTFFKIGQKILFGGLDIDQYEAYFFRAYFTNNILNQVKRGKEYSQSDELDGMSVEVEEYNHDLDLLIPTVKKYVLNKYPETTAGIFIEYYCRDGQKVTFRDLAKKFSVSLKYVHKSVHTVLEDLRGCSEIAISR